MDFEEKLRWLVFVVVVVVGGIYVVFMGTVFLMIIVDVLWSWAK